MLRRIRELAADILRQCDMVLLALCVVTTLFGLVMIASATRYMGTYRHVTVQAVASVIGMVLYALISTLDLPEIAQKSWKVIFLFSIVFIGILWTPLGVADDTGNRAWVKFPFLPVSIQPAEFVKLTLTLLLAKQLDWLRREKNDLRSARAVGFLAGHLLLIFGLYFAASSDMGSGLVFIAIFAAMCFVAGVAKRWFLLGAGAGGIAFYLLWEEDVIPIYMKNRFRILFDHSFDAQGVGWHQTRSLMTLGGGKLTGQGLFHGTQTQSTFSASLPNRHTDFIFSVVGEELGMLGCVAVLLLLSAIMIRCIVVARHARSRMETYICVGVTGMLLFQMVANVGMCLFVLPVIGLTLPFFSYGGSAIVALYMAMGMVSSVHSRSLPDWLR